MFEKLFLLVKSNATNSVFNNPAIPARKRESVINDASSSIIEVFKNQLESGKLKDLVKFFQLNDVKTHVLARSVVKRFANKLNNYYHLDPKAAILTATALIVPVIQHMIKQSHDNINSDFAIQNFVAKLSNGANLTSLVNTYMAA